MLWIYGGLDVSTLLCLVRILCARGGNICAQFLYDEAKRTTEKQI